MNLKEKQCAMNAGRMMAYALSILLLASSCQQQQTAKTNQTQTTTNQQLASQPVIVKPPSQELRTYQGVGVVTKVVLENPYDKTLASVELNHEEIEGLMPPMIMEFYVKEKSLLNKIKVGDKVDFTVEAKGGTEIISEIKKKR